MRYDSRAYLHYIRNIDRGLRSRDKILRILDDESWLGIADLSKLIQLSNATIRYHLNNLESDGFVHKQPEGGGWKLREIPQGKLSDYIKIKKPRPKKKSS